MKLTKRNIVLLVVAALGLLGFFMMFVDPIKAGGFKASYDSVWFGKGGGKAVWMGPLAFVLLLLSGVAVLLTMFVIKDESLVKLIRLVVAVVMVVAGVVLALTLLWSAMITEIPVEHWGDFIEAYDLTAGPVIASLCGIAGGVGLFVGDRILKD